jgi:transposase InsO family protein
MGRAPSPTSGRPPSPGPRGSATPLARFGTPEIFNTDQGSQFTSTAFTSVLQRTGVRISMDGRGRWLDNVFIERLWRSLKYEEVYLKSYADGCEARAGIAAWIVFYNHASEHPSGYVVEAKRFSWAGSGIAGCLAARSLARRRAAELSRKVRLKIQGP